MNGTSNIDIYKDSEFADLRVCLDAEMKRLQRAGHGSKTRKAEPFTVEEEEMLWETGLLGKSNPQALVLVDTILVRNGIYFALGVERNIVSYDRTHARSHFMSDRALALTSSTWKTYPRTDLAV